MPALPWVQQNKVGKYCVFRGAERTRKLLNGDSAPSRLGGLRDGAELLVTSQRSLATRRCLQFEAQQRLDHEVHPSK